MDEDCVTSAEFKRVLAELYKNDYVLVDVNETFKVLDDGTVKMVQSMVPVGKKPIIISIDDMVYDPNKLDWGIVHKIILDKNGDFATYTKLPSGEEVISKDNEVIPILEQFIADHPDFSPTGARMCLALTGYVGILGYRVDRLNETNRQEEIDAVTPIVAALKARGYTFASHGYGHRHSATVSYAKLADDTQKWKNEVENIVGPTQVYVYPYGESVSYDSNKGAMLRDFGYKIMWGLSNKTTWMEQGQAIFATRQGIDGYSLRNYHDSLANLFDTTVVYDPVSRHDQN